MGLRQQARADACKILSDTSGFAWPVVVRAPDGKAGRLRCFSTDIADLIDIETGQAVSGRQAEVTISMTSLRKVGLDHPIGIADGAIKPWVIEFEDIEGAPHAFKVMRSAPDRTVGVVLCYLEVYVA